jgi:hypothetical protein
MTLALKSFRQTTFMQIILPKVRRDNEALDTLHRIPIIHRCCCFSPPPTTSNSIAEPRRHTSTDYLIHILAIIVGDVIMEISYGYVAIFSTVLLISYNLSLQLSGSETGVNHDSQAKLLTISLSQL